MVRPLVEELWEVLPATFTAALGHRWRYARVARAMPPAELPPGFHFAGDALTSSRIEDAWLAGVRLVESDRLHA